MSEARIIYTARPAASPEGEIATLANVYSFVIRCAEERKKGGFETIPESYSPVQGKKANTKEVSNVEL